jgi:hypothetical protein
MLELPNIAAYQDVHVRSALLTCVQHIALWDNHQLCLNVIPPPSLIVYEMQPADSTWPSNLHTAVFFSLQSLCLMHAGKPTGVAVSHCITGLQTQQILTTCQIQHRPFLFYSWYKWNNRSVVQVIRAGLEPDAVESQATSSIIAPYRSSMIAHNNVPCECAGTMQANANANAGNLQVITCIP